VVCWDLIDSASSGAKGPALVLSLCPAWSRAGRVGQAHWALGGDGGLAGGHRGEGGGHEDGQQPDEQPASEVTPPPPRATAPESSTGRPEAIRSVPVFLMQLAWTVMASRKAQSYLGIYFLSQMEFGGAGKMEMWPVFIKPLTPESHWRLTSV